MSHKTRRGEKEVLRGMGFLLVLLGALLLVILFSRIWDMIVYLAWRPYKITRRLREQGVHGPGYRFWSGSLEEIRMMRKDATKIVLDHNSHDITPRVLPHYHKWLSQYGGTFLYWFGPQPRVCITDPNLIKQILSNKFGFYNKQNQKPNVLALLGRGLVFTEGADWARHRRVVSPAFTMDKLKTMARTIVECAVYKIRELQNEVNQAKGEEKGIDLSRHFQELTADVISHTSFGNNFAEGKEVFLAQKQLQKMAIASALNNDIPGSQYFPTKTNMKRWRLDRKVKKILTSTIQGRLETKNSSYGNDLLGLMLEACHHGKDKLSLNMEEIIDECKTFFFAGHETTSYLLTWTMFLLSTHQEWQENLRKEVLRECGEGIPEADSLGRLKQVTMVLLETLRLYSPVMMLIRKASKDMQLGNLVIPKNTVLTMPLVAIHREKGIWGPDAKEFNPQRFENGISMAAMQPNALLSFSIGPRACVGQNFAMLEAKIVTAMILQKFSFKLSPEYKHAPADMLTLQPQYGLPIILTPLHN